MNDLVLNREYFKKSLKRISETIEEQRDHLSHLDSEIGDGDHGINMSIGFREVIKRIDDFDSIEDISLYLKKIGMTLLGKVGGASGPLYGSFFMSMGDNIKGKSEVTFEEFVQMIELGIESIEKRGKATTGQKTMLDSFRPGINYLKKQTLKGDELNTFKLFIDVMRKGADSTTDMIAQKGRSARLGKRAIGHKDPGAESAWIIMNCFYEILADS